MKIVIWEADIIGILVLVQTDLLYNNSSLAAVQER